MGKCVQRRVINQPPARGATLTRRQDMRNMIVEKLHNLELALHQYPRAAWIIHRLKFSRAVMGGRFESLGAFYNR